VLFPSDVVKAQSSLGHFLSEKPHDMKSRPSLGLTEYGLKSIRQNCDIHNKHNKYYPNKLILQKTDI